MTIMVYNFCPRVNILFFIIVFLITYHFKISRGNNIYNEEFDENLTNLCPCV